MHETREYALNLGVHVFLGGEKLLIEILSPEKFRVQKLLIPIDIAKDFAIDWIKIKDKHQFLSTGPLPAILFRDDCTTPFSLKGDLVQADNIVEVAIINKSKESKNFQGILIGSRCNESLK